MMPLIEEGPVDISHVSASVFVPGHERIPLVLVAADTNHVGTVEGLLCRYPTFRTELDWHLPGHTQGH